VNEENQRTETVVMVCAAISQVRLSWNDEADLQGAIAEVLDGRKVAYRREVVLSPRDRVDFWLPDGIGLEVKIGGSVSALTRQLFRYAELPQVNALVVVVTKYTLGNLPKQILGKPVSVVHVSRAFV
jgi:hypothetical protein